MPETLGFVIIAFAGVFFTLWIVRRFIRRRDEYLRVLSAFHAGRMGVRVRGEPIGMVGRMINRLGESLAERASRDDTTRAWLSTILDALVEGVFVTDERGRITLANTTFLKLFGGDAFGKTPVEAVRNPQLHEAVESARRGTTQEVAFQWLDAQQVQRSFVVVVSKLRGSDAVVGAIRETTREMEADRIRQDFVANASHELRTPITAIRGFTETLLSGSIDDEESTRRFLTIIGKHAQRLEALAGDLSLLSEAESRGANVELHAVDVGPIVMEVVRGLERQADDKGLTVSLSGLEELPPIEGHERSLDQVFVNLIDNAFKYTPPGGEVSIDARVEDDLVVVCVSNTGPGIPRSQLDRVFERFYRVDAGRSREIGGTGLGLSIVKHLVASMGARITVESDPGERTTFCLELKRST